MRAWLRTLLYRLAGILDNAAVRLGDDRDATLIVSMVVDPHEARQIEGLATTQVVGGVLNRTDRHLHVRVFRLPT